MRKSRPLPRRRCLLIVILFASSPLRAGDLGWETLAPGHWAYPALERLEALGLCSLPSQKPLSREELRRLVAVAAKGARGHSLASRDRYNLERLEREFTLPEGRGDPRRRYDPPLAFLSDPPLYLEGDATLSPFIDEGGISPGREAYLELDPSLRLHLPHRLTYEVSYRLLFGPEKGQRVRNGKPTRREKSFKGLTSLFERSYLNLVTSHLSLQLGRDYVNWGPWRRGGLLVSDKGQSLDMLLVKVSLSRWTLTLLQALLSPTSGRHLAAHRLEVELGRWRLGISESVVYAGRGWDPVYAFPLSSFYANQFNERGDDNILWGLDAKVLLFSRCRLEAGLLIDDFQFERGEGTPDKIAADLGAEYYFSYPLPGSFSLAYRYVDIYTYTHRDTSLAYLGGEASASLDPLLGAQIGPDSDLLSLSAAVFPRADVSLGLRLYRLRHGEGRGMVSFEESKSRAFPPFPSGVVEERVGFIGRLRWELPRGSWVEVEMGRERVENEGNLAGRNRWRDLIGIAVVWDG